MIVWTQIFFVVKHELKSVGTSLLVTILVCGRYEGVLRLVDLMVMQFHQQ